MSEGESIVRPEVQESVGEGRSVEGNKLRYRRPPRERTSSFSGDGVERKRWCLPSSREIKRTTTQRNSVFIVALDVGLSTKPVICWYIRIDCGYS